MPAPPYRLLLLGLSLLAGASGSPSLLPGDGSFEADGAGFLLCTGQLAPALHRAAVEAGTAADGRRCVRLTALGAGPEAELQSGWVRLEAGAEYHLSAYVCGDRAGLEAIFSAVAPNGARQTVKFVPTVDWRRYDARFTLGTTGWRFVTIGPAAPPAGTRQGSIFVDAVRLDAGQAAPYEPVAVLGATLRGGPGLRRAGDRADFDLRLYSPADAPGTLVRWRVEDPFGQVRDVGSRLVDVAASEPLDIPVRLDRLRPGALRLVATAGVGGARLTADATVVAVSWELGGPDPWFGAQGATGTRGLAALELLRIGIEHGLVPSDQTDVPARPLAARRRARITTVGSLAPLDGAEAVAARVARFRGWIKAWSLDEFGLPSTPEAEAARIATVARGLRSGDPGALGLLLRATGDAAGLARLAAVLPRLEDPGDAVVLALGDGAPEGLAGMGTQALLQAGRATVGDRRLELGVTVPGWAAAPWDTSLTPAPEQVGEPLRLAALEQASRLVRSLVLAKAGGADFYLYPGAPLADRADALTMLSLGRTADGFGPDGHPLPFAAALDHALDMLRNRRLAARLECDDLLCLRFQERRPLAVLWRPDADGLAELRLPAGPARLNVTDLFGQTVVLRGDGGAACLSVGRHPIFVESAGLDAAAFAAALAGAQVLHRDDR